MTKVLKFVVYSGLLWSGGLQLFGTTFTYVDSRNGSFRKDGVTGNMITENPIPDAVFIETIRQDDFPSFFREIVETRQSGTRLYRGRSLRCVFTADGQCITSGDISNVVWDAGDSVARVAAPNVTLHALIRASALVISGAIKIVPRNADHIFMVSGSVNFDTQNVVINGYNVESTTIGHGM
ncbi:MAG: hypothetical protein LBR89_04010 [Holosporales bacterium]|nr:hypothetical protein [Holosporales bacterium]